MKRFIAIIPARGGSVRFPGKNIYPLNGKPLISYSIEEALSVPEIMDVYVSTDDQQIASVSQKSGSKIINRPDELSTNHTTTVSALQHAVLQLLENGVDFEYIVLLQPTNPLRPGGLIYDAIKKIEEGNYDSLMTVSPLVRKLGKIQNQQFIPWNYSFGQRSQDMSPLFYENGLLYISSKELLVNGRIMGDSLYPMIVEHIFSDVDIDTKEDLIRAEILLKTFNEHEKSS